MTVNKQGHSKQEASVKQDMFQPELQELSDEQLRAVRGGVAATGSVGGVNASANVPTSSLANVVGSGGSTLTGTQGGLLGGL